MKKLIFIGCLVLMISCQTINSTPQIESAPTISATLPPTETVTPAPTLPPAPTLTSTPIPLFFTEEFNANLSAWTFFQTGGAQLATNTLENDSLNIQMTSPHTWYYAIHNAHEYQGVSVSAKFSGSPSGSIGVVCDYSEANGWYEFNLTHEGTFSILFGQWLAEGVAEYKPILNATSEYLQTGNMNYEIGLICADNTLFLHINGKLFQKVDVTSYGLAQGRIGITASSFDEAPMNAIFEWVKVSAPE